MRHDRTFSLQYPAQFSLYVRTLRRRKRLTQHALGEMIGVTGARISQIEKDPGRVALAQVLKLLHVLGARAVLETGDGESNAERGASAARGEW